MQHIEMDISEKHFQKAERTELLRGGREFFESLIKILDESREEIHVQVYILEEDQTGKAIIDALIRAVRREVKVYLVLDEYGSGNLSKEFVQNLQDSGIQFKWFKPVMQFGNWEFGRRMHHKIIAIDESVAIAAGVNFADRYNDTEMGRAWLDFGVLVEGTPALEIKRRCLQIWESPFDVQIKFKKFRLPQIKGTARSENTLVKVSVNDWLRGISEIFKGYQRAFRASEKSIVIVGGYFLPGRRTRQRLRNAVERGVQIKVILTHTSDVPLAKEASEYLYQKLFRAGIEIFEWTPGILHGKVAVVDGKWTTIGSYNINYLSTFESLELNFEILDEDFAKSCTKVLDKIIEEECMPIEESEFMLSYSIGKRLKNRFAYWFVRNSFRLLNAFSNKPKPN